MFVSTHQFSHPPAPIAPAGTFHLEMLNFIVCSNVFRRVCNGKGILAGRACHHTTLNVTCTTTTAENLSASLKVVLECITHRELAEQAQQSIRWVIKMMSISARSTLHSIGKVLNIV